MIRGNMSNIVYEDKNLVIINKPVGVSSQPDNSGAKDAMALIREELAEEKGTSELYVIHRLDLVVGGLLVYARNKRTAAKLSELVANGSLGKEYLAAVEGECTGGEMTDYLYKNSAIGKSSVVRRGTVGAKLARLEYERIETVNTEKGLRSLVKIKLITGRFHQIRAQFSSRGMTLVGDGKYGSSDKAARTPALFAHRIEIPTGDTSVFTVLPDTKTYPWSLFSQEAYKKCQK